MSGLGSVAIVGSGAVGLYYGIRLASSGADVRFLVRGDLEAIRSRGTLILTQGGDRIELRSPRVFGSTEEIGPVDVVIVTLKTTQNASLAGLIPPLLGPGTAILTLQNGLGSDERLAEQFGAERIMGGLAYLGSHRTGPGEVACSDSVRLAIGEFQGAPRERTRAVAEAFAAAGVRAPVVESLASARWHKLVWNVPFNGLSIAAGGVTTDQICSDRALLEEVRELMKEIQTGARAVGHAIEDHFLEQQVEVTPRLGAYQPSSLVDFLAGREVEVEPIWGEPLRRARAAGAVLPRLALLHALLGTLAGGRGAGADLKKKG